MKRTRNKTPLKGRERGKRERRRRDREGNRLLARENKLMVNRGGCGWEVDEMS